MLSGSQSNASIDYKSKQLTLNDVKRLQETFFDEKEPVNIHSDTLEESALLPFCQFLQSLKCLYITIYFEKIDYQAALFIYQSAKENPHTLKVKLDLGEQFLGYLSAGVLNNAEAQDMYDHLICGIYKDVRCLALHSRSINYFQLDKIFKGLYRAPLEKIIMDFNWLDDFAMTHLDERLQRLGTTKEIQFLINGIDQIQSPNVESVPVLLQASSLESEPMLEPETNCWQRTLTWMMSKLSCTPPAEILEPKMPSVAHRKLS